MKTDKHCAETVVYATAEGLNLTALEDLVVRRLHIPAKPQRLRFILATTESKFSASELKGHGHTLARCQLVPQ